MSSVYKDLIVGSIVKLKLVEVEDNYVIVSYKGQLLRVSDHTGKKFEEGQIIKMVVKRVKPLEFAISGNKGLNVWA